MGRRQAAVRLRSGGADEVGRMGRVRKQRGLQRWARGVEAGSSVAEIGRCR